MSKSGDCDRLRNKVKGTEEQIEALAEHLAQIPKGISPAPIYKQMQRLEELKRALQVELDEVERAGMAHDVPVPLETYTMYLERLRAVLTVAESDFKIGIIQRLIHQVEILPGSFRLHFKVGKSRFVMLPEDEKTKAEEGSNPARLPVLANQKKNLRFGSNTVDDGGRRRARTCDLRRVKATL